MTIRFIVNASLGALLFASGAASGADAPCPAATGERGEVRAVIAATEALEKVLKPAQRAALARPIARESAIRWSNLPVGIVPRAGLRLGDLDATQSAAAHRVAEAALSACGLKMLDEIRMADDQLMAVDSRKIGWSAGNYYMSVLGKPSAKTPWMLQIGGHHIAYNFTFNGAREGATPLFFGTEPISFTADGVAHEPLAVQSTAMSNLAGALSAHPQARLSGTFTDVVKGVVVMPVPGKMPTGGTDTGFPQSYPTGTEDRGILYGALGADAQANVRAALESYASLPGDAITHALVAAYEAPAALAQTYVGYSGTPDLGAKGTYVRIDGPRIWMEFVVQPAVADPSQLHYHALWRDKTADYGGEIGK
ncbi:MAG TPA: DUF3500 domain-containing protein [Steroidobacteraceae bacterium]|jgi:hypothetical protein|nr:DUF3500 domain-containing protein [Steroidobacteraceae bacterium]